MLTSVITTCRGTNEFLETIGLHQGLALSPYPFTLIMDWFTTQIQEELPWCILFANDILLVDESRDDMNMKFERWWEALEFKCFTISRKKTE